MNAPPLSALLLAGGKSRRMGRDKAELVIDGGPTLRERSLQLLHTVTDDCFLSIAADDERSYQTPALTDRAPHRGPLAGLEAAIHHRPDHAWLVLACDFPLLDVPTMKALCADRRIDRPATAFTSRFDGRPEPLCAIYEPGGGKRVSAYLAEGTRCARRFLESLAPHLVGLPNRNALDNCNRPEDLAEAAAIARDGVSTKRVAVEYFAQLRERAGTDAETRLTDAATASGLWEEVRMAHSFDLHLDTVRPAVDDRIVPWTTPLRDGDRVAFLPPFAGG